MKWLLSSVLLNISLHLFAQVEKTKNYRRFDERIIHFGVMMGFNSANFNVIPVTDAYEKYGLVTLENQAVIGGQVGFVNTLQLFHPVVRLRTIPTLSFQERALNYVTLDLSGTTIKEKREQERVNSTNLDVPVMLQFRTMRLNNFASYLLIGAQYSYDFQSQENASQSLIDPFIKIKAHDFQGQVGAGLEFFAPYFKFGFEVKYSQGFSNSFIQDGTPVSKPIDQLQNKVWWVSFIFEG